MRAKELLSRYEAGERTFKYLNLSGKSFKGQNLSGVDFTGCNLRGTDFTNATLKGGNFSQAKLGLLPHDALALLSTLIVGSSLLGAIAGSVDALVELEFHSNQYGEFTGKWLVLLVLGIFGILTILRGVAASFIVFIIAFLFAGIIAFLDRATVAVGAAIAIATTVAAFVAVATFLLVLIALTAAFAFNRLVALIIGTVFTIAFIIVAYPTAETSALALAVAVYLLSTYIGAQAYNRKEKYAFLRLQAIALSARWGTCFRGANLTDADFATARIKSTDFEEAILTRTRWHDPASSARRLATSQ